MTRRPGARPARRGRRLTAVVVIAMSALAAVGGTACDDSNGASVIDRERYVEIYVELLEARAAAGDSAAADSAARAVLDRHGATATDLEAFVRHHSSEPGELASVWREIEERLRAARKARADSAARASRPDAAARVPRPDTAPRLLRLDTAARAPRPDTVARSAVSTVPPDS